MDNLVTMENLDLDLDQDMSGSWEDCDIDQNNHNNNDSGIGNGYNDSSNSMGWRRSPRYSDSPGVADQLPSIEEAKTNAAFATNRSFQLKTQLDDNQIPRRELSKRRSFELALVAVAIVLSGVVWFSTAQRQRNREKQLSDAIQFLSDVTPPELFEDAESPQFKALNWLLFDDPMKLEKKDRFFIQRYVIAVFGIAVLPQPLHSTFHFFSPSDECDWRAEWKVDEGKDKGMSKSMGIVCNGNYDVQEIIFQNVGLTGQLPSELAALPYLVSLNLINNALKGTVPPLPNIKLRVDLSFNNLDGDLNNSVFSRDLNELVLSENVLKGQIPESLRTVTGLKVLALDGNQLTGGINNLFGLYNLQELYLQYNEIEDQLSNGSFQELKRLQLLNAHNNRITGPLPDALWSLTNLIYVDFHANALDGRFRNINEGLRLRHLDISENFLGGGLPDEIVLLTQLNYLDVSSNRFEIELPNLEALTNMETLLLTDNMMFGPQPIPEWLQKMTHLRQLSLRLTSRSGTIPEWFSSLTKLELLDLDWNHISGTIPNDWSKLSNLQYLMLNRNWISGSIPTGVAKLPNLKMFFVDNNKLVGNLDACQVDFLIADCGDPQEGCPNCPSSITQEVNCPCCTHCCFDGDEYCNYDDWLSQILSRDDQQHLH